MQSGAVGASMRSSAVTVAKGGMYQSDHGIYHALYHERKVVYTSIYTMKRKVVYTSVYAMVYTTIHTMVYIFVWKMVYTMVYTTLGIYHGIYQGI